jgi:hypothetical protein
MVLTGTLLFEECTTFQTAYRIIMVNEIIVKYAWISTQKLSHKVGLPSHIYTLNNR